MHDATGPLYPAGPDDGDHKGFIMRYLQSALIHVADDRTDEIAIDARKHNQRVQRAIDWVEAQDDPGTGKWR